jgi:hypothetical protein
VIVELGAGLGLISILLDKSCNNSIVISTDGDADSNQSLVENIESSDCSTRLVVELLRWGNHDDENRVKNVIINQISSHRRTMNHDIKDGGKLMGSSGSCIDTIIGADIIYEEEQIIPLFDTVKNLLLGTLILLFLNPSVT